MGLRIAQCSGLGTVWNSYAPDVLDSQDPKVTVGGGESALLYSSFELAKRGHDVTVYYPGDRGEHKGVKFESLANAFNDVLELDYEAVVSWSDQEILRLARGRRVFSQQLNDLPRDAGFWGSVDVFVSPARIHAAYLLGFKPPGKNNFHQPFVIMPSGVERERYVNAPPFNERKYIVSYWSSPDRGLQHLLLVWPRILEAIPEAELHVFYHLDRFVNGIKDAFHFGAMCWTARLLDQVKSQPGVFVHGAVSRNELAKWQMQTRVMAYPCDPFSPTEGFAQSIGQALGAGARVVAHPADAIQEVWGPGVRWVPAPLCDEKFRARFADAVIEALLAPEWLEDTAREAILNRYTWAYAAEKLEKACTMPLGKK